MENLKIYLDNLVSQNNTPDFIKNDPVQFPHRFKNLQDIEIVSLLVAHISWGNRKMILNSANKMLNLMRNAPFDFLMNRDYENLGRNNVHRTFFENDLKYYLAGLYKIYSQDESLNDFLKKKNIEKEEFPAWKIADYLRIAMENDAVKSQRCYGSNTQKSALKRLNMAIRWLVRNDGIVDLGVWDCLQSSQLFIPLDVHVATEARRLKLLNRKQNDKMAVVELTNNLKKYCPEDPVKYDFALFGGNF